MQLTWHPIATAPEREVIWTRSPGSLAPRKLVRIAMLWFLPDRSSWVAKAPTEWRPVDDARAVLLTADLIRHRDGARRLLGANWESAIAGPRELLRDLHARAGGSLCEVAFEAARRLDAAGHDPGMLLAALVEEVEAAAMGDNHG